MTRSVEQVLAAVQQQIASSSLRKDWTSPANATTGINFYDLELGAKLLVPVITPLRNAIPRVSGKGGIQANWRAVTGINTSNISAGVGFGKRGGKVVNSTTDYTAVYKALGLEDAVDWEADLAAMGFDDVKALAVQLLLWSLMIQEEKVLLGGNSSAALGTTPTASLTGSSSGGSLATATYSVIVVALTRDGYENSTIAGGVPAQISRTNADGTTSVYGGGSAQKSASATVAITGPNGSIAATVTAVNGAVGYAWYWGTAGNELLGAITTINSVVITAAAAGTENASTHASDNSTNSLIHDGLFTFAFKSGLNGYWVNSATGVAGTGSVLTSDGAGGVVEIDTDLKYFWDNYRLSPEEIWVNAQEQKNITLRASNNPNANGAIRLMTMVGANGEIVGARSVRSYLNKFTMSGNQEIPVKLHPNLPPGTILYVTHKIPYPLNNVGNVIQVRTRRDYYQIDWPTTTRSYGYGVYTDQVLQHFFPPSIGVRSNIANG